MTVRAIADLLGASVEGDDSAQIESLSAIDEAGAGQLTFAADARHANRLAECRASAAIVGDEPPEAPMSLIRVDDVQQALAELLGRLAGAEDLPPAGLHPTATIDPDAQLADDVAVGAHVTVAAGAKIAAGCALCANVVIGTGVEIGPGSMLAQGVVVRADCRIGSRVRIGPNSVIGYDGFGYFTTGGVHRRISHIGNVVIEDDVELGACVCVDRGKFASTVIGAGTKIDNLVQIGHSVRIGRGCLLAGQCGIAGSARLGDYVVLGGSVGVRDNITLGDGVVSAAYAAIAQDVPAGQQVSGIPARPVREAFRIYRAWPKLPELLKRVKTLEAKVQALESPDDH